MGGRSPPPKSVRGTGLGAPRAAQPRRGSSPGAAGTAPCSPSREGGHSRGMLMVLPELRESSCFLSPLRGVALPAGFSFRGVSLSFHTPGTGGSAGESGSGCPDALPGMSQLQGGLLPTPPPPPGFLWGEEESKVQEHKLSSPRHPLPSFKPFLGFASSPESPHTPSASCGPQGFPTLGEKSLCVF